jgi:surface polysaccharide O-acyltransferase-like enzyme
MTLSRTKIIFSALVWVMNTLITIIGTYLLIRNSGQFDGFFYDFVSLNVILASGAAFLLLRWISERTFFTSANVQLSMRTLATSTFGIYLIHVIVIEVLRYGIPHLQISSFMGNAIWSIPVVSTIVFIVSFLIVHILQKIPILKHIVP